VRSRKDPICNVEVGNHSANVGHLIVIALRHGKKLQWDSTKQSFSGPNAESANGQIARPMRKPYDYSFVS
jgi:hypothetical protein